MHETTVLDSLLETYIYESTACTRSRVSPNRQFEFEF